MILSIQDIIFGCILIIGILVIIIKINTTHTSKTATTAIATAIATTNSNILENFNGTPETTKTNSYNSKNILNTLSNKYKKYAALSVPISMTDYGRTCMSWSDTNNPAYSKLKGNQCSNISSS